MRYLLRRFASGTLLLGAISLAVFALAEIAPGDFVTRLELDPQIPAETVAALRQRYGLDRGPVERYFAWIASVATGELGYSLKYEMPVGELLAPRARNTLLLTLVATAVAWGIALPLGTWTAWRENGWVDRASLALAAFLLAMPELVVALVCLLGAGWSGLFPTGGMTSVDFEDLGWAARIGDVAWHLVMPVTVLVLTSLPTLLRHVRAAVSEALDAPFLRHARGHGIPVPRLLFGYALLAAANPLISLFGFSVAGLVSGALIVEVVLSWPGMGPLLVEAILARDLHLVAGTTLLSAFFVVLGQLLADLMLFAADPRVREGR